MHKFTPGPWRRQGAIIWGNPIGRKVAHVVTLFGEPDADNANAKLIAACPEMYEALHEIAQLAHNGGLSGTTLDEMRKLLFSSGNRAMIAIAKAEEQENY